MTRFGAITSTADVPSTGSAAVSDAIFFDGVATSASTTFTSATANFSAGVDAGKVIHILRAGPSSQQDLTTTISSVTNSTTVVLANAPGRSQNPARFYISRSGDQTATIQAEIDALEAAGGGTLRLTGVGYLVSQLILGNRVWIQGNGMRSTLVHQLASFSGPLITNKCTGSATAMYTAVLDMWLDGNKNRVANVTNTLNGAYTPGNTTITLTSAASFTPAGNLLIGTNRLRYTSKSGNVLSGVSGGMEGTTDASASNGATVTQSPCGILFVSDPYVGADLANDENYDTHQLIERVTVKQTKGDAIVLFGRSESHVRSCFTEYCDGIGIRTAFDTFVVDCDIALSGRMGVYILNADVKLANCKSWFSGNITAADGHGYMLEGGSSPDEGMRVLAACGAQDNKAHGFRLLRADRCVIQGTASSNGTSSAGTYSALSVESSASNNIIDIVCADRVTTPDTTQQNALDISNLAFNNTIRLSHGPGISGAIVGPWLKSAVGSVEGTNQITVNGVPQLVKPADQLVTNSATLTDDNYLQVYLSASTKYCIRGIIYWDTTATGDFKYAFIGPTSPTLVRMNRTSCIAGGTPAVVGVLDTALPGSTALVGTGTTGGYLAFDCIIHNGANAGVFKFQFAQNTQTAAESATVRAGSWIQSCGVVA